jgi:hypothetical protein
MTMYGASDVGGYLLNPCMAYSNDAVLPNESENIFSGAVLVFKVYLPLQRRWGAQTPQYAGAFMLN